MTPQKRTHHMSAEEPSSEEPQDQATPGQPMEDSREYDPAESELSSDAKPADLHASSTQAESAPDEAGFSYPAFQDGENGYEPLPGRLPDDEPIRLPGSRRRRRPNRLMSRPEASELGERLESMARHSAPTFDFFFFSLLAGAVLGLGYILDQPAVLLFGILIAPILAPWVGAALATATGELRFLGQSLGGFFTALFMVFITGILGGLASRIWMPITTDQALLHARLWIPDLLLVAIGTLLLTIAFVHAEEKPVLASLMVTYEFYLPISAAGFGLGNGATGLWPQALWILLIHLAISMVLALIVFYYMGFRPLEISGYAIAGLVVAIGVITVAIITGLGLGTVRGNRVAATKSALILSTQASSSSGAAVPATNTVPAAFPISAAPSTPTYDLVTATPGITPSPTSLPTPVYGRIHSLGDGAVIRVDPSGAPITTVQNGYLVEILPDPPVTENGSVWVRVSVKTPSRDIVGWVQLSLISTATPSGPSSTPTTKPASP